MRRLITARPILAMLLSGAIFLSPAVAGEEAGRGKAAAQACLGCHGIEGYRNAYPSYRVPKIGGQSEVYLVAALKAYRAGERAHPTMQAQSATLSDEDIAVLAAFFSDNAGNGD